MSTGIMSFRFVELHQRCAAHGRIAQTDGRSTTWSELVTFALHLSSGKRVRHSELSCCDSEPIRLHSARARLCHVEPRRDIFVLQRSPFPESPRKHKTLAGRRGFCFFAAGVLVTAGAVAVAGAAVGIAVVLRLAGRIMP